MKLSQTVEAVMEEEADLNELNIAGWGFTEENQNSISDVLMQASIPFVSNDKCIESYQKLKSRAKVFPLDITDGHLVRLKSSESGRWVTHFSNSSVPAATTKLTRVTETAEVH